MSPGSLAGPMLFGLVLIAVCALALLMRSSSTGARRLREGRVTLIVGQKGHGKTLFSVHEVLRYAKSRGFYCAECSLWHPPTIASNGHLKLRDSVAFIPVKAWSDVVGVDADGEEYSKLPHGTLLVIDELGMWSPAVASATVPKPVRWFLAQCRKCHVEVMGISQHESRVSAGFRAQTDEVGICRKGFLKSMTVRFFEPEDCRRKGVKPLWTFRYRVRKPLIAAYDTYALLKGPTDGATADERPSSRLREVG